MLLLILTLIFALLIAIFAVQNAAPVAINLFWITTQVPLVLVILGSVLAGALIVLLIAAWNKVRPKKKDNALSLKLEENMLVNKENENNNESNNESNTLEES